MKWPVLRPAWLPRSRALKAASSFNQTTSGLLVQRLGCFAGLSIGGSGFIGEVDQGHDFVGRSMGIFRVRAARQFGIDPHRNPCPEPIKRPLKGLHARETSIAFFRPALGFKKVFIFRAFRERPEAFVQGASLSKTMAQFRRHTYSGPKSAAGVTSIARQCVA